MNHRKFILLFICLAIVHSQWVVAQVATLTKQQFVPIAQLITSNYYSNKTFKVNTIYNSYESWQASKPTDSDKGYICVKHNKFVCKNLDITQVQDLKYNVTIDDVNKTITLRPITLSNITLLQDEHLTHELDNETQLTVNKIASKYNIYTLVLPNEDTFAKINYTTTNSNQLIKAEYFYSQAIKENDDNDNEVGTTPKLEIAFVSYTSQITASEEALMNTALYITVSKEKVVPTSNYKNYKLIDLRHYASSN